MKIAIVNNLLEDLIAKKTPYKILWKATDGKDAVKKCLLSKPDLLLLDLIMPNMNGVEATRLIMKKAPCSILVVTHEFNKNVSLVFEAMGAGALDVLKIPSVDSELIQKIENIRLLMEDKNYDVSLLPFPGPHNISKVLPPLLVIGASTGGPTAIRSILKEFKPGIPFSVIILQHIDQEFAASFAKWLQESCLLKVNLIEDGTIPKAGCVYVAGKNAHLTLDPSKGLSYAQEVFSKLLNKPSIDIFFESLAMLKESQGVACLLTGMGSDGAKGLLALKKTGFKTIIEDESSSIVYGMPKAARGLQAADYDLPLTMIGKKILELMKR